MLDTDVEDILMKVGSKALCCRLRSVVALLFWTLWTQGFKLELRVIQLYFFPLPLSRRSGKGVLTSSKEALAAALVYYSDWVCPIFRRDRPRAGRRWSDD